MSNNKLSLTLGVTPNEYTILEAYYAQILTSDWAHKMPNVGQLNKKADSPISDHLTPYEEKGVWGSIFKELLTTDKELGYGTDDPYGVYLTVEGSRNRYSFLWNAGQYDKSHFFVYQLGAKLTKNAPELGFVQGGLVYLADGETCKHYGTPLFREALKTYEQILEFHVLPRKGKEDTLPTPAELLAILQGYGEYPDIDSVIATAAKEEAAKVAPTKKSVDLKESPEKSKRTKKKPSRVKRTSAEWATLWSVAAYVLPIIATVSACLITGNIGFALAIGVVACLPLCCNGWSFVDELLDTQDEDSECSTGDK